MLITKTHEGAWVISALVDGYLSARTYHFYTRSEAIHEFLQEHNMFEETTNEDRAARIDRLVEFYQTGLGEVVVPADECRLAYIVADMMHWCDQNGENFDDVVDLAEQYHAEDQPYVET